MKKLCIVLAGLLSNNVNAEWGEQWGSMVWGQSSANVPMMGGVGQFIFFGLLLVIGVFVTKRWGLIKTLPAVAVLSLVPLLADADEIQLNTFQNGQVADADDVNENFTNLKTAIDNHGHGSTGDDDPQTIVNAIVNNATNIAANMTDIANNTSYIDTNVVGIANNTSYIDTNVVGIATNVVGIATNAVNTTSNANQIANNIDNIGLLATDITTNATGLATNADGIATHTTEIGLLANEITTNADSISSNDTDIASLSTAVISLQTSSALSINHVSETFNSNGELFCYSMESIQAGIPSNCSTQNIFRKTLECPNNSKALSGGCRLNIPSLWLSDGGSYLSNYTDSNSHTCVYNGDTDFTMTIFVNCLN